MQIVSHRKPAQNKRKLLQLVSAPSHTIPLPFPTFSSHQVCSQVPLQPPAVLPAPAIFLQLSAPELSGLLHSSQSYHCLAHCQAPQSITQHTLAVQASLYVARPARHACRPRSQNCCAFTSIAHSCTHDCVVLQAQHGIHCCCCHCCCFIVTTQYNQPKEV